MSNSYYYDTETQLYYLQSRYYDPELGRFINADAFASTGQGLLGNNMFAYCRSNPVNNADNSGNYPVAIIPEVVIPALVAAAGAVFVGASSYERKKPLSVSVSKPLQEKDDQYSVYFLKESGDIHNEIVYVGRVKTSNLSTRMSYHSTRNRELVYSIDGLNYNECRFVEQVGMIWCHTISANPLNNQIRGIGPRNAKRYTYFDAGRNLAKTGSWLDDFFPISYFANQTENMILNGGF